MPLPSHEQGVKGDMSGMSGQERVMDEGYLVAINKRVTYHQRELRDCLEKRDAIIRYYKGGNGVANNEDTKTDEVAGLEDKLDEVVKELKWINTYLLRIADEIKDRPVYDGSNAIY